MLISYQRAITSVIKDKHPGIDENYVFLSFEEVTDGSLCLKCRAHLAQKYVLPAFAIITTCFQAQNFNKIPNNAIEDLRAITRFAKKHECQGSFMKNGESVATFNQFTEVEYNDSEIIKGDTTIYGIVQIAGGKKNPRATLKINNEYTISIEVKKDVAKRLAAQLYNEVGSRGTAKWDKRTYRVLDFQVDDIIFLEEKLINDTFKELGELLGNQINKLGDYNYLS